MLATDRQVVACPPEVAVRRYAERAPVSVRFTWSPRLSAELLAEYDRPAGMGELIMVDTTLPVDFLVLAGQVRARLTALA
jgi:hypothetical protein